MALTVALAQFNASVGDIGGNIDTMRQFYNDAVESGADVIVFPELCVCGYPPEDLLLRPQFLQDNFDAVKRFAKGCSKGVVIVGFAQQENEKRFNSLAVIEKGQIQNIYHKNTLPNYSVFDEKRYFEKGSDLLVIEVKGMKIVLTICEDIWEFDHLDKLKTGFKNGMIINISASPFNLGKINQRQEMLSKCAKHFDCAVAYCNLVGGQDELVFDGRSMFADSSGTIISQAKAFEEDILIADINCDDSTKVNIENIKAHKTTPEPMQLEPIEAVYKALLLGTRDYLSKNGFNKVLIGLSGGIDSSLTAAIAVDALGAENVIGVTMPSRFSSAETISDAEKTALNMKLAFHTIAIEDILKAFDNTLKVLKGWDDEGLAFENLQARIRGCILMSMSNQFGYLVLTTGNKSETAVGYSTLYGDTAGGFAVIKDVPKTMVYKLSSFINNLHGKEFIPVSVIERPPSAELKADQKDSDSLPEYDVLDNIIKGYIEQDLSRKELAEAGMEDEEILRITSLIDRNEYKRRQSPPGIKITPKAFGKDRRMPINNRYRG
jgi:NAD+ synthase (glutamine-hydrolysing)